MMLTKGNKYHPRIEAALSQVHDIMVLSIVKSTGIFSFLAKEIQILQPKMIPKDKWCW